MLPSDLVCDVCGAEPAVGVAAVPGVPVSVAYGRICLSANAHPMWVLAGNTATIVESGQEWREHTADWWQGMVDDTLAHLAISEEDFIRQVDDSIQALGTFMAPSSIRKQILLTLRTIIHRIRHPLRKLKL